MDIELYTDAILLPKCRQKAPARPGGLAEMTGLIKCGIRFRTQPLMNGDQSRKLSEANHYKQTNFG